MNQDQTVEELLKQLTNLQLEQTRIVRRLVEKQEADTQASRPDQPQSVRSVQAAAPALRATEDINEVKETAERESKNNILQIHI